MAYAPCIEKCTWSCTHQGSCSMPCAAPCDRLPCDERCAKILKCGHQCPSLCGEDCPNNLCQECGTREMPVLTSSNGKPIPKSISMNLRSSCFDAVISLQANRLMDWLAWMKFTREIRMEDSTAFETSVLSSLPYRRIQIVSSPFVSLRRNVTIVR